MSNWRLETNLPYDLNFSSAGLVSRGNPWKRTHLVGSLNRSTMWTYRWYAYFDNESARSEDVGRVNAVEVRLDLSDS